MEHRHHHHQQCLKDRICQCSCSYPSAYCGYFPSYCVVSGASTGFALLSTSNMDIAENVMRRKKQSNGFSTVSSPSNLSPGIKQDFKISRGGDCNARPHPVLPSVNPHLMPSLRITEDSSRRREPLTAQHPNKFSSSSKGSLDALDHTMIKKIHPAQLPSFYSRQFKKSVNSCCSQVKDNLTTRPLKSFLDSVSFFPKTCSESINISFFDKKILFLLLLLLNILVAAASPAHRVRHRHLRHTLRADRLCDKPGLLDQPTHEVCDKPRVRRDVNTMSLREGQESSLCLYSVCTDEDLNRRPVHIHRVFCLQSGCRCTEEGSYRCTQLFNKVEVWYGANSTAPMVRGTLEVEYGCVCAAKHGTPVDPVSPDLADK